MSSTKSTSGQVLFPVTTPVTEELYTEDEVWTPVLYVCIVFFVVLVISWCGDLLCQEFFPNTYRFLPFKTIVELAKSDKDEENKCSAPSEIVVSRGNTAQDTHNNTVEKSPPPYSLLSAQDTEELPPAYQEGTAISLAGLAVNTKNKAVYLEVPNKA